MTGQELVHRVNEARERRDAVIDAVCGACENKCCEQMTMMGTQDLRRLVKTMLLDGEFAARVRQGLRCVSEVLEADLRVLEQVLALLKQSTGAEMDEEMQRLRENVEQWREFVQWLRSDFPLDFDEMRRLLMFSGIRSNTLNALAGFPAGLGALVNLSGSEGSFEFRGKRIAPPPCLFYLEEVGCICDDAKPAKCANFFCAGVPNLLEELRGALGFDDFVLANCEPVPLDEILDTVGLERELGPEFVEPKIVLGADEDAIDQIATRIDATGELVRMERVERPGLRSASEVEQQLESIPERVTLIEVFPAMNGNTLYELALALDRLRQRDEHPGYVIAAKELMPTSVSHPLWDDRMMAQPLGVLDLYVVSD